MSIDAYSPAQTLEEALRKLNPRPLKTPEELERLYEDDLNKVRGQDRVKTLSLQLVAQSGGNFFKRFLIGHSGVGKSTELYRLMEEESIQAHFRTILLSAENDLNPSTADGLDVMECIVSAVVQAMQDTFPGWAPDIGLVNAMRDFFREEETISKEYRKSELAVETTAQAGGGWPGILKLMVKMRAGIRAGAGKTKRLRESRTKRLAEFSDPAALLLEACNAHLLETDNREWLVLFDDFEKSCVSWNCINDAFVRHGPALARLDVHLVVVAPLALICSKTGAAASFSYDFIPDTPVFERDHKTPHEEGRAAVREVIAKRIAGDLLAEDQIERIVVGSGGNLRDCFELLTSAAVNALARGEALIEAADVTHAVNELRRKYEHRLGDNPLEEGDAIPYTDKAERLEAICRQDPNTSISDTVTHALIAAGAVQEFNSDRWYGVHPMVVEILRRQGKLVV